MHTTDDALGPGQYTLITRTGKRTTVKYQHDNNVVLPYLQSTSPGIILLTESQRTPEWFLLRKFRITGTGAYGIWKYISSMSADLLDENMNAVIEILSMQSNGQELVEPPEVDNNTYKTETLNTMLAESSEDLPKQESTGLGIESNYHPENLVMENTGGGDGVDCIVRRVSGNQRGGGSNEFQIINPKHVVPMPIATWNGIRWSQ